MTYDIEFHWDPVCPFAWITSRWVEKIVAQKSYSVDWQFISLRLLNRDKDYATEFPPDYERGHTAGLRMLRVAAALRADQGRDTMGPLYTAYGESIWDREPAGDAPSQRNHLGSHNQIAGVLGSLGHDVALAAEADNAWWDDEITAETDYALSRTGRDVGTPIVSFHPPEGPSFFGPVISRVPNDADAVELWDSVIKLATFPGFSELKRSLREAPQLRVLGATPDEDHIIHEDWQGGARRA